MPIFGTFDTMTLADLAQWLHDSQANGALTVSVDTEETYLKFDKGQITAVGTGDPLRLDIGQILLSEDVITDEQLQEAVTDAQKGGTIAERLTKMGATDEKTLEATRRDHAFEMVIDLFHREEGSFHFTSAETEPGILAPHEMTRTDNLGAPISTRNAVIAAMQRLDEWRRIRDLLPNNFTVVKAVGEGSDDSVWKELDEQGTPMSIGDLCLKIRGSRFKVFKAIYDLHRSGHVALDELLAGKAALEQLGPVNVLVENARVLLDEQQYDEAREILSTVTNLDPENEEARNLLRGIRKLQMEYLYSQIPPHKVPILSVTPAELSRLSLPPREAYLASRLIGKWDVATLVVATPLGELETLQFLRKFLHAGIATFSS